MFNIIVSIVSFTDIGSYVVGGGITGACPAFSEITLSIICVAKLGVVSTKPSLIVWAVSTVALIATDAITLSPLPDKVTIISSGSISSRLVFLITSLVFSIIIALSSGVKAV